MLADWNGIVLVTYRRYYQWLPSAHAQHSYHTMIQSNQPWPTDQNSQPPTFESVLKQILHEGQAPPYPYIDAILKYHFPLSWNVRTLNLHDESLEGNGGDIVTSLLCDVFQAPNACKQYHPVSPKRTSPAKALVYDRLNVQANLWGWMNGGRRFARMKATRQFVEQHGFSKFPAEMDCPDTTLLEQFLERSLALEHQILGTRKSSKLDEQAHRLGFWNASSTFCTVNADKSLLEDAELWKSFYGS